MTAGALQRAAQTIGALRTRLDAAEAMVEQARVPLVILGLSVRVPGGVVDAVGYWGVLRSGVDVTSEVPEYRWGVERPGVVGSGAGEGLVRTLRGGWLGRVEGFDAAFWGISPREAAGMDPQQRLLLECAWEALEDAGLAAERLRGRRVGVYVGICASDYAQMVASGGLGGIDAYHASGTQHSVASGRIAYALGLRGGAVSVDTACSSSLVALHLASRALRNGECDLAIVGGVNLILTPLHSVGFSRAGMLSADGRCKAFSSGADGYGRAEGCAVVVLGRQGEVPAGRAWAVLRGSAVGQDGASGGLTVPNGPAQAEVIRAALADAGADAGSVGYIEAHGTGTALGDPIEAGALATVFGAGPGAGVPIGSAKANLGHAEGAAGLLGVVKAVLMRHHGEVPPHPYAGTPSEHVDWAGSGLRLPAEVEPLGAEALVGVSSFGFSGTNAHAVIGPAPAGLGRVPEAVLAAHGARQGAAKRPGVYVVSARSEVSLAGLSEASAQRLSVLGAADAAAGGAGCWLAACGTSVRGRAALVHRRAVVARDGLAAAAVLRGQAREDAWGVAAVAQDGPGLVWLFTGQGALRPGAGLGLVAAEPAFARAWREVCAAFAPYLPAGTPGLEAVLHGPDAARWLERASLAQPAHVGLGVALARLWRGRGVVPLVVLGHSLGEYVAAHVAGVLDLDGLARLVAGRGALCEGLAPGGMAATTAGAEEVEAVLAGLPGVLAGQASVAADHGVAGSTVAGSEAALGALCDALLARGHASERLAGGQGYHSPLVEPAMAGLAALARGVAHRAAEVALVSSWSGAVVGAGSDPTAYDWGEHWAGHLRGRVRYAQALAAAVRWAGGAGGGQGAQAASAAGIAAAAPAASGARGVVALEIGAQPVLGGLNRRILPGLSTLPSIARDTDEAQSIQRTTASLWTHGTTIDWDSATDSPHHINLPAYVWARERHWTAPPPAGAPAQAHPLLGDRQPGPGGAIRFLARLDTAQAPLLAGHGIDGTPVLPAAAMLVMAAEASRHWRPCAVQDAQFEAPLPLREPMALQFILTPEGATASWELHATPLARSTAVDATWTRHATGRLHPALPADAAGAPPPPATTDAAAFHAGLAAAGLTLSDAFRGLRRHGRDADGVMAEIDIADAGAFAPMLRLDAALQAAALLATDGVLRVPALLGTLSVLDLPDAFRLRARRLPAEGDDILADLDLWSMQGVPLGRIGAIRLRRRGAADPLAGLAWSLAWQDAPERPAPDAAAAAQAGAFAARLDGLRDHAALLASLDRRAAAHAGAALVALGVPDATGAEVPAAGTLGIAARHHALFARLLAMLEEDGALRRDADARLRVVALPTAPTDPTPAGPEAALLDRCGTALPALLRGVADPLDLLFADGAAGRVHRDSLWSTPLAAQLADAAATLLAGQDAPRVLEIGGGTGGTTAALLPRLPDRARYVFTDVAASLLAQATARFGRPGFATQALDIERPPAEQGFGADRFDLVVAANVLHATRDLRATLRHVRGLVADGGTLALTECTVAPRWGELTFGLTEGWWRFTDAALRSAPPMLDPAAWRALLQDAGFEAIGVLDAGATPWRQAVILARAAPVQGHWLVLGGATARGLAQHLTAGGARVTALPASADAAAALAAIPGALAGVVLACATEDLPDDPLEAQAEVCLPALHLVRALVADGRPAPVWLVTRGAVDAGADGPPCPAQAALWGFGRTLRLEHPELAPRLIDLGPDDDAAALAAAIRAPDAEAQLALRDGRRRMARLRPEATPPALPAPPMPDTQLGAGMVEIAVQATGVNFRDVLIGLGAYPDPSAVPGVEALGTVAAVGPAVAGIAPGDTVLAIAPGAFGARLRAAAALCVPVDAAGGADRAGLPVAYLTAAWTLRGLAAVAPGQRVLIHAAAGGTGLAALHVARLAGAEVVAAASRGKHDFLRGLGLARVLDSRDAASLGNCGPVDVVLSSLGAAAGRAALAALVPGGCFLELGRGDALDAAEAARLRPDIRFHAIDLAREMRDAPDALAPVLRAVLADVAEGVLPPLPVTRTGTPAVALKRLQAARYPGKLVVTQRLTDGTVLLTGAFGGLGLVLARVLVARGVRHLVLAGRRPPLPAQQDAIEALRAAGANVRTVVLDVTDAAAVARLLDEVDAGAVPLRGVVHAVGVVEDAPAAALDDAAFERVLAPKLAGAWALHEHTIDRRLDLFVLCSSAAGTLGNPGQAAHAAANAALDALAQRRRAMGLPGMSIAWGPWAGTGTAVTAAVERRLAARGMPALAPDAGSAAFGAVLESGLAAPVVMRIDAAGLRAARGHDPLLAALPMEDAPPRPATSDAAPAAAPPTRARIEETVRAALAAVLGLAGPGAADPRRLFFDQGMDSLTSLEFRNRLQATLGRPLAAGIALDHPTIDRLVAHLAGDDAAPDLDAMDDAQLGALLDARLDGVFGA